DKLRKGEIAALSLVAGKPAPLIRELKDAGDLHLVEIPFDQAIADLYVPTQLTAKDYPNLVQQDRPVRTIAVGSVLAVAELRQVPERSQNVANFVDVFFTGFQSLLEPGHHAKWHEVNLAAELPGWRRYPPAEQWLQRNLQIAKAPSVDELRLIFSRFIDERRQASGSAAEAQHAEELRVLEARHAEELKAVDAELAEIAAVEQAADAFARKYKPSPPPNGPEQPEFVKGLTTPVRLSVGNRNWGDARF